MGMEFKVEGLARGEGLRIVLFMEVRAGAGTLPALQRRSEAVEPCGDTFTQESEKKSVGRGGP